MLGRVRSSTHHHPRSATLDDNWTYKRQAWSLVGNERAGAGELGRFSQGPQPGEEADWPFAGSFDADVSALEPGVYYPNTMM